MVLAGRTALATFARLRHPPGFTRPRSRATREVSRARHRLLGGQGRQRHHRRRRHPRPRLPDRRHCSSTSTASCPPSSGCPEPAGQGVADWLASDAPPGALDDLAVDVDRTTRLIPRGVDAARPAVTAVGRARRLAGHAAVAGRRRRQPPAARPRSLGDDVRSLLVTRACYLALRRAVAAPCRPDGVVLVAEPGRALRTADVDTRRRRARRGRRSATTRRSPAPSTPGCSRPPPPPARPRSCGGAA